MSDILRQAVEALNRWESLHADEPLPSVAVYLTNREKPVYFTGLSVAPSPTGGAYAVSGKGYPLPIFVLRDADVDRVVIGETGQAVVGFGQHG